MRWAWGGHHVRELQEALGGHQAQVLEVEEAGAGVILATLERSKVGDEPGFQMG